MDIEHHFDRVRKWVMECYQTPPSDGDLRGLKLVHLGLKNSELWAKELGDDFTVEGIDPLVNEILNEAWDDAESLGGIQKYKVEAYFGTKKRAGRKKRFSMHAGEDASDSEFSEPANGKGLVAQQMRHNEALMKMSVNSFGQMMKMLGSQLEKTQAALDDALEKNYQMIELRERLLSEQEERELQRVMVMKQEDRKDELVEGVKLLLPSVVRRVSGKLLPENANADDNLAVESLKALASSLSQEQIQAIMSSLKPQQTVAFMEVLKTIGESEQKKGKSNE